MLTDPSRSITPGRDEAFGHAVPLASIHEAGIAMAAGFDCTGLGLRHFNDAATLAAGWGGSASKLGGGLTTVFCFFYHAEFFM